MLDMGLWVCCRGVVIEYGAGWGTRGHLPRSCFVYPSRLAAKFGGIPPLTIPFLKKENGNKVVGK